MNKIFRSVALVAGLAALAPSLHAQGIYFGLRGGAGIPTGGFSDKTTTSTCVPPACTPALDAAKSGFGYGADAGLNLGPIGVYAGFDHMNFDCESATCNQDGKYKLQGVAAGARLTLPGKGLIHPWVKGGVTFNELQGAYGTSKSEVKTDRNPGYEAAVGLDIGFLGILSITPQARYVGQNFKYKVPGVTNTATQPEQGTNYFTFDLGLQVHNPLAGMGMRRNR